MKGRRGGERREKGGKGERQGGQRKGGIKERREEPRVEREREENGERRSNNGMAGQGGREGKQVNDFKSEEIKDGGKEGRKEGREQDAAQLSRPTPSLNFSGN